MKIKRLYINNYKSLVDFELIEPNPFSVFVGPNAAGKSNIFEALEFFRYWIKDASFAPELFGSYWSILNKQLQQNSDIIELSIQIQFEDDTLSKNTFIGTSSDHKITEILKTKKLVDSDNDELKDTFEKMHSRIFIDKKELVRIKINGNQKLRIDAANLASVLKRVIEDPIKKEEIIEWLQLLIPEFEDLQISRDNISGIDTLLVKEKHTKEYFKKDLLSDGTYNILSILTAVYQSDEPQFLCIEEPENGLNPYVIRTLVEFFRNICEEKGHYIWLNTHSQTLVRELQPKEIILIDKKEGITKAKQIPADFKKYNLTMDEAWLTNALGGGLPW